jgi:hypothetical protein
MKFIFYLLFLFQGKTCKPEIIPTSESINLIENVKTKVNNSIENEYFINSIDNNSIGKKIDKVEEIKNLKEILSHSLEREIERPYMWDVFVSSNDTLLHFFHYKSLIEISKVTSLQATTHVPLVILTENAISSMINNTIGDASKLLTSSLLSLSLIKAFNVVQAFPHIE